MAAMQHVFALFGPAAAVFVVISLWHAKTNRNTTDRQEALPRAFKGVTRLTAICSHLSRGWDLHVLVVGICTCGSPRQHFCCQCQRKVQLEP
eukprot:2201720-Amphidinium_carterae.2